VSITTITQVKVRVGSVPCFKTLHRQVSLLLFCRTLRWRFISIRIRLAINLMDKFYK